MVKVVLLWLAFLELLDVLVEMRSFKHDLILVDFLVNVRLIFTYFGHDGGFPGDDVGAFGRRLSVAVVWSLESVLQFVYFLEELFFFYCVDVIVLVQLCFYLVSFVQQLLIRLFQTLNPAFFVSQDLVQIIDDALQLGNLVFPFLDDHKLSLQSLLYLLQVINERFFIILKLLLFQCHLLLVLLVARGQLHDGLEQLLNGLVDRPFYFN